MIEMSEKPIRISKRYEIVREIGSGGMGVVFQAYDRLVGTNVALKTVTTAPNNLQFASIDTASSNVIALAQEFRVLSSLRHPNIIDVLDYGFDAQEQPFFTMALLDNPQSILSAYEDRSLEDQIDALIQILQALSYLHRRNILHRDLKPTNVAVVDGQVLVLDFGLAITTKQLDEEDKSKIVGTYAYMAPEILQENPTTKESDLYSFGVMAFELLAGEHPFPSDNVYNLLHQVLNEEPDTDKIIQAGAPEALADVIDILLLKDPSNRYSSAEETIAALSKAIGKTAPTETVTIRESFIQAADFIGRNEEMSDILVLLSKATDNNGGLVLVGGESGVGKSRFLNEVRSRVIVQGIPVLRGNSITNSGTSYEGWRDILRELVLWVDLSDFEASILKPIVPDIARLLGRDIPDAPPVEPSAARDRFLALALEMIQRIGQPMMFVLEDLQWARPETMTLLKHFSPHLAKLPLLILGSYRDDEVNLQTQYPDASHISLHRLESDNIAKLCESILGEKNATSEVVNYLQGETEGNVFFLVETVRLLSQSAGQIDAIATMELPQGLMTGGIMSILNRRLERVPDSHRPLLHIAALMGRTLDPDVLISIMPDIVYDKWLADCSELAILDVEDNRWRFAHDKLREQLVSDVASNQRTSYHRQIAEAIDKIYSDDETYIHSLAYHWDEAQVASKAAYYLTLAGEQDLYSGAYEDAIQKISRAMELDSYSKTKTSEQPRLFYARRSRMLGEAHYYIGQLIRATQYLEQSLEILNLRVPKATPRVGIGLLGQIITQATKRFGLPTLYGSVPDEESLLEAVESVRILTAVQFIGGDFLRWAYVVVRWLNTAEASKNRSQDLQHALSFVYAIMTTVTGTIPIHKAATSYQALALENVDTANKNDQATVWTYVSIYTLGNGQWELTSEFFRQARKIYEEMGHPRRWEELSIFTAFLNYYKGNFERAFEVWEEQYPSSLRRGDTQMQYPPLIGRAQCILRTKSVDELFEADEFLQEIADFMFADDYEAVVISFANYYAVEGAIQLRRGQYQDCWETAEKTLTYAKRLFSEAKVLVAEIYDRLAEMYLMLWLRHKEDSNVLNAEQLAIIQERSKTSIKLMKSYAKVIGFASSRSLLWQGWLEFLLSNTEKAYLLWKEAVATAQSYEMDYEEARALHALIYTSHPEMETYKARLSVIKETIGIADPLMDFENINS